MTHHKFGMVDTKEFEGRGMYLRWYQYQYAYSFNFGVSMLYRDAGRRGGSTAAIQNTSVGPSQAEDYTATV
ncbi:hypothetical protein VNO78_29091 [Psophocarpus tetragonolobus]|uniref:Uncharacterized protein n=1 Tax=Psophocarpus tetragonolobus TaxID=3891 RepID=A0AAN9X0E1_PSOTE